MRYKSKQMGQKVQDGGITLSDYRCRTDVPVLPFHPMNGKEILFIKCRIFKRWLSSKYSMNLCTCCIPYFLWNLKKAQPLIRLSANTPWLQTHRRTNTYLWERFLTHTYVCSCCASRNSTKACSTYHSIYIVVYKVASARTHTHARTATEDLFYYFSCPSKTCPEPGSLHKWGPKSRSLVLGPGDRNSHGDWNPWVRT